MLFSVWSARQAQCGSKKHYSVSHAVPVVQKGRRMDGICLRQWHPEGLLFPPVVMCSCYAQCILFWRGPFPSPSVPGQGRQVNICVLLVVLLAQSFGSRLCAAVPADTHTLADTSLWEQIDVKLTKQLLGADNKACPFIVWST